MQRACVPREVTLQRPRDLHILINEETYTTVRPPIGSIGVGQNKQELRHVGLLNLTFDL